VRDPAASGTILSILAKAEVEGRTLRQRLALQGFRMSLVAFYAMMARMEDEGTVSSRDVEEEIDGIRLRVRYYRH